MWVLHEQHKYFMYNSPFIQYYFHSHLVLILLATLTPTSCEKYHELLALYDFPSTFLHDDQLYQKKIYKIQAHLNEKENYYSSWNWSIVLTDSGTRL